LVSDVSWHGGAGLQAQKLRVAMFSRIIHYSSRFGRYALTPHGLIFSKDSQPAPINNPQLAQHPTPSSHMFFFPCPSLTAAAAAATAKAR
jgi:hypothetical protein